MLAVKKAGCLVLVICLPPTLRPLYSFLLALLIRLALIFVSRMTRFPALSILTPWD